MALSGLQKLRDLWTWVLSYGICLHLWGESWTNWLLWKNNLLIWRQALWDILRLKCGLLSHKLRLKWFVIVIAIVIAIVIVAHAWRGRSEASDAGAVPSCDHWQQRATHCVEMRTPCAAWYSLPLLLARRCTSLPMGDLPRHPKFKKGHTYLPTFGPWQEIRSIQLHHIILQYVCMYIKGLRPLPPTPEAGIGLRFNLGRRVACTVMFEAKVNGHVINVIAAGGTTYLCRSKSKQRK